MDTAPVVSARVESRLRGPATKLNPTQFSGYGPRSGAKELPTLPNMRAPSLDYAAGKAPQEEVTRALDRCRLELEKAKHAKSPKAAFNAYLAAERLYGIALYLAGSRYRNLLDAQAKKLATVYHSFLARMHVR